MSDGISEYAIGGRVWEKEQSTPGPLVHCFARFILTGMALMPRRFGRRFARLNIPLIRCIRAVVSS